MNAGTVVRIAKRPLLFARMLAFAFALKGRIGRESMERLLEFADAERRGDIQPAQEGAYIKDVRYFAGVILNRGPFNDACLPGSLMVFRFLRSAGIDATINFGIESGKTRALKGAGHVWVCTGKGAAPKRSGLAKVFSYP